MKATDCDCKVDTYFIYLDGFGVTGIECPKHGPLTYVDKIEFDSMEDYERWRNEALDNTR